IRPDCAAHLFGQGDRKTIRFDIYCHGTTPHSDTRTQAESERLCRTGPNRINICIKFSPPLVPFGMARTPETAARFSQVIRRIALCRSFVWSYQFVIV